MTFFYLYGVFILDFVLCLRTLPQRTKKKIVRLSILLAKLETSESGRKRKVVLLFTYWYAALSSGAARSWVSWLRKVLKTINIKKRQKNKKSNHIILTHLIYSMETLRKDDFFIEWTEQKS